MKKNKNIIGIGGVAGAGKDLLFNLVSKSVSVKRFSLADELKEEVRQWCLDNYGIDSVKCSRQDKEIIRPFLVFHGTQKRDQTQGRYWVEKLHKKIQQDNAENIIITDIRYDDYEKDEVHWLKNEIGGKLIHLRQYEAIPDSNEGALIRHYKMGINSEESRNDPKLREKADVRIEWPHLSSYDENALLQEISSVTCLFK